MASGNQRERLFKGRRAIHPACPGFAGMIAGLPPTRRPGFRAGIFKAADVVALPAMERDGNCGELLERRGWRQRTSSA